LNWSWRDTRWDCTELWKGIRMKNRPFVLPVTGKLWKRYTHISESGQALII